MTELTEQFYGTSIKLVPYFLAFEIGVKLVYFLCSLLVSVVPQSLQNNGEALQKLHPQFKSGWHLQSKATFLMEGRFFVSIAPQWFTGFI